MVFSCQLLACPSARALPFPFPAPSMPSATTHGLGTGGGYLTTYFSHWHSSKRSFCWGHTTASATLTQKSCALERKGQQKGKKYSFLFFHRMLQRSISGKEDFFSPKKPLQISGTKFRQANLDTKPQPSEGEPVCSTRLEPLRAFPSSPGWAGLSCSDP